MKLYSEDKNYKIYQGSMLDMLEVIDKNSLDSIICDPPYELNFMNKSWDNSGIAFQKQTWQKCFEVLKSGGYLLAFGGTRTFHRIACAIEDAGFEIRDTIMWLYGSGFPKSLNIGLAIDKKNGVESIDTGVKSPNARPNCNKTNTLYESGTVGKDFTIKKANNEWDGWGTCLKPAYEPIIVARKPFKGSLVDNVLENGVGGLNIDECRVDFVNDNDYKITANKNQHEKFGTQPMKNNNVYGDYSMVQPKNYSSSGRFPANLILTYDENDKEEVCGGFPNSKGMSSQNNYSNGHIYRGQSFQESKTSLNGFREWYNDEGSAARYFYCAKASKKDRDNGLDALEDGLLRRMRPDKDDDNPTGLNKEGRFAPIIRKNTHPTVKPVELMQYLVRLVSPKGATVLDCFMGSGSTGKAVMFENRERNANYKFIGIEMTEEYLPIAKARIEYARDTFKYDIEKIKKDTGQLSIFDFMEGDK